MKPGPRTWLSALWVWYAIFAGVAVLNLAIFLGLSLHLGGDAFNGKTNDGHYYLYGYNAHTGRKEYTQVRAAVFRYSKAHVYSILVTWPLMLAGGVALARTRSVRRTA